MSNKNLLLVAIIVLIFAVGAIWYFGSSQSQNAQVGYSNTIQVSESAGLTNDELNTEDVAGTAEGIKKEEIPRDVTTEGALVETSTTEEASPAVEGILSNLDSLFDEEYDDSELESEFNNNDVTTLTESYGI